MRYGAKMVKEEGDFIIILEDSVQQLLNGKGNQSQLCVSASKTYIRHAYLF